MTLDEALNEAYRTWAETGASTVPEFNPSDFDSAVLAARLAGLQAVNGGDGARCRCVVSLIQARWLEQATA